MRIALALALAITAASSAQAAQDRYGPPRPAPARPVVLASLEASRLSPGSSPQPARLLNWPAKRPAEQPPTAPPAQAVMTPAPARLDPAPPLPASLYARPQPDTTARTAPPPSAPAVAVPPPQRLAALAAPTPAATPPHPPGPTTRYYSLHREYGLAPDHAPEQSRQPRYVLIGPPDTPKPSDNDGAAPKASKEAGAYR